MYNTGADHTLHDKSKVGFTYRLNPITNKWEWWWLDSNCWGIADKEIDNHDCVVSYEDTWAEPNEDC